MELTLEQRKQAMDRVTWWGVLVNIMLAVSKLVVGFIAQSHALIADGFHSLSDLISDAMVLLATKHAHQDADEDHPYGHARYETLATIGVGIFLVAVALGISIDAIQRLAATEDIVAAVPATLALWIAAFSIFSNEMLYQYTIRVAHSIRSKLLEANAWHHRTDSISSIVVFIGIGGAILGWPLLDDIAAIIVGLMIAKIGWDLCRQSVQELVDTALEPEVLSSIKQHIKEVNGVVELHMLRSRRMGHNALVDVHILVDSRLSVSEGHQISEAVEHALINNFDEINDVTVHIDPEDDEHVPNSCKELPLRDVILERLQTCWKDIPETSQIASTTLHYLNGKIEAEIDLPLSILKNLGDAENIKARIQASSESIECIREVHIRFI
jgi:cation diffusion facilitator family transporter